MDADIIEKTEGPTPWVSPVCIVPKPSGEIRLCDIDILKSVLSRDIINSLDSIFTRHRILESMITDNGPQFISRKTESFTQQEETGDKNYVSSSY